MTIADDSHNHVISNVDGLQAALNAKQDASTSLTTSTTFGGDVSGAYNAIVVANDSHTHDGRYYTESEIDTRIDNNTLYATDALTSADDLDSVTDNGFYRWTSSAPTNNPSGTYHNMIVQNDGGQPTQLVWGGSGEGTSDLHIRRRDSGTWRGWTEFVNSSTQFGGDVSGTYDSIVIADDSHNHVISNVDGLQSALDDLTPTSNDTFSGTYPLVWVASDVLYSSTFMTINGATDTLSVPNISTGTLTTSGNALFQGTIVTVESANPLFTLKETDTTDKNTNFRSGAGVFYIRTGDDSNSSFTNRLSIAHNTGDISFYDDSGNAKLFWDANAANFGVGTTSPDYTLHAYHPTTNVVARFESGDDTVWIDLHDSNSGTYGALLGHDSTNLFKVGDSSASIKMKLSPSGLLDTDAGYSVLGTTAIDSSRNATLGTISSGAITSTGTSTFAGIRVNNANTALSQGSGNSLRIQTNSGYVDVGPKNTSWAHFDTDRGKFYFGQDVHVNGQLYFYDAGTNNTPYWHAGNDGSGSGLDADTVDGLQASAFTRADTDDYRSGWLGRTAHQTGHLVGGHNNLGSTATTTSPIYTIGSSYNPNSTTLGNMYGVGFGHSGNGTFLTGVSALTQGTSGWGMYVASDGDARIFLNSEQGTILSTGQHYAAGSVVWNAGNDGSGSGLDADLLDGLQASSLLRSDADDDVSGHTEWQDNYTIRLGNGADFRMWHNGTDTVLRNYKAGSNTYFQGEDTAGTNHAMIYLRGDTTAPYVELYYDGGEVMRTVSGGIEVSNTVNAVSGYEVNGTNVINASRQATFDSVEGTRIGVNNTSATSKDGISLYNGYAEGTNPTYGLMFTGTSGSGTHGDVTGDWATYFTMNGSAGRGWIFRNQSNTTNVASISNAGYLTAARLYVGDGTDGYFYSDNPGRTAFRSGDFYIMNTVSNFYNYATNQYYGDASGDNILFRGNTLSGDGWSLNGSGDLNVAADYVRLFNYTHGTVPTTVGIVSIHSGGKTGWAPGDELGRLRWYADDTSGNWPAEVAAIKAINRSGNGSTTTVGSAALEFYTSPYNASNVSLALRLDLDQTADFQNDIKMGGTAFIDSSRSLLNLSGTVKSDSTFSFLTGGGGAQYGKFYGVSVSSTYTIGGYGGYFNAQNGYMVGNTIIVDSSRNLTNIDQITANDVRVNEGHGHGYGFWGSGVGGSYRIYMSQATNGTYGGRVSGETTSDYNMYFKMQSGTNRGFVFRDDANNYASINPNGIYSEVPYSDPKIYRPYITASGGSGGDDALLTRWRYNDGDTYYLDLNQRVTSSQLRWAFSVKNSSSTWADRLVFKNANVGIGGTQDPGYPLDVADSARFQSALFVTGRIDNPKGSHGGYSTTSGTGSDWGACIWSIGDSWAGSGTGSSYSIGTYGLHWLRAAHADEIAFADEGLYLTRSSTTPYAALGRLGAYFATKLASTGEITAYYSDERLKRKTGVIENALSKVLSLEGFTYVENELARELGYNNTKEQVGVSAQAVQRVLPQAVSLAPVDYGDKVDGEIVSRSGEDYLTVDYSRLVPLLVESIKELSTEVERLKQLLEKDNGND